MINARGKLAAIVLQSAFAGKNNYYQEIEKDILKNNTLKAVITMNPKVFPGVGTRTEITIFMTGVSHGTNKLTFLLILVIMVIQIEDLLIVCWM